MMKQVKQISMWGMGLVVAVGLTGCGAGGAPAQVPQQAYVPAAGTGAGTGSELHPLSVTLITPSAEEVELLHLINEVRTQGTVSGKNVIPGSCVADTFVPGELKELSYSGVLAHAATKQAEYMGKAGYQAHGQDRELGEAKGVFYGVNRRDRVQRSITEAGLSPTYDFVADNSGENVAGGTPGLSGSGKMTTGYATPGEVMEAWMKSPAHCQNLMNADWDFVGTAYYRNETPNVNVTPRLHQNSWVQVFGRGEAKVNYTFTY